jgi:septal ring factor EnvC (AmiA/AmiB activator)
MSDEITVGHAASHLHEKPLTRMAGEATNLLKQLGIAMSERDLLKAENSRLRSEKQTIQQVVFERDKVIAELRAELAKLQAELKPLQQFAYRLRELPTPPKEKG